jgi:hypothetical protein
VLLQDPEDVVEDTTVINPRNPRRLFRQHGLDGGPFIIGEFVRHDSSPEFGEFESQGFGQTQRFWPGWLRRRLWAEADINQPTIRVETVEDEPKPTPSSRIDGHARDQGFSFAGAGPLRRAASSAAIARLSARP